MAAGELFFSEMLLRVDDRHIFRAELPIRKSLRERSLEVRCPEQQPKLVADAPGGFEEDPSICLGIPTVITWNSDC